MMNKTSVLASFNARWISAEDVARTFVPTPQFNKLLQPRHSLLMGPRGCGKTTLLKMLTRRARLSWSENVATHALTPPPFETVYVPVDVKFTSELHLIPRLLPTAPQDHQIAQRALVNIAVAASTIEAFDDLIPPSEDLAFELAREVADLFSIYGATARLLDVRHRLIRTSDRLKRLLNTGDHADLRESFRQLPDLLLGAAYDPVIRLCDLLRSLSSRTVPGAWALAFDELEIAPQWLQTELLAALRSTDQSLLLKLTWSPILPRSGGDNSLRTFAEPDADYDIVRMWYSHAEDVHQFSRSFVTRIVLERCGEHATPNLIFGKSEFAAEPSTMENTLRERIESLARKDNSFRQLLKHRGLRLGELDAATPALRDSFLRKVKPIVLLRDELLFTEGRQRSRKFLPLYFGEDVIASMSDGNPRWLSWITNELLDTIAPSSSDVQLMERPVISPALQARVLRTISKRFLSWMRSSPRPLTTGEILGSPRLSGLIEAIAAYFFNALSGPDFPLDPPGSYTTDDQVSGEIREEVKHGLIEGAFLFVGSSELDVPDGIRGARLRLSFMFAPYYRLPLRNYRPISLSHILTVQHDVSQRRLPLEDKE